MKARFYEKIYHEILDDPKLGPLNDGLKWRFVSLIIAAGRLGQGGILPELSDLAWELRVSEEQLRTELPTLARRELVELATTPHGERWFVTNYAKRQGAVPAAERQKRSRERKRSAASAFFSDEDEGIAEVEESIVNIVTDVVTCRDNNVTAELLAQAGIARNKTTAPLFALAPAYVEAHLSAAPSPGLAIRRMLDNDPPPAGRRKTNQVPAEFADVVKR